MYIELRLGGEKDLGVPSTQMVWRHLGVCGIRGTGTKAQTEWNSSFKREKREPGKEW